MNRSGVAWCRAGARSAALVLPVILLAACSPTTVSRAFTGDSNDLLQTTDGGHTWRRVTVQIGSS